MDKILNSINNNKFVFWEEIARDGAQAKTILSAKQRIDIAKQQSKIFEGNAAKHLVFAAGFTSISTQEQNIIKQVANEVEECYVAVNCRSTKNEIDLSIDIIKDAKYPRVAFVFPASERLSKIMLHKTLKNSINTAIEISKYAKDKAGNIPIDIQLAGSFDTDPNIIAEISNAVTEQGIAICHLGDTRGGAYPEEIKNYFNKLISLTPENVKYGVHFHNDLSFALNNNIEAIKNGIMLASTSWLGLAERNGLVATELLTFLLSYQPELLQEKLGINGKDLFSKQNNLKLLKPIADLVSEYTKVQAKITDPITGPGVNSISTGTPFVDPISFQPFPPEQVLGISKTVLVTQLASKRVITEAANELGFSFTDKTINKILLHTKEKAYKLNRSAFPKDELIEIFKYFTKKAKL